MRPFYTRSEIERIELTEQAVRERRTLTERWAALATPESEDWNTRAAMAADWLRGQTAVVDLGCGTMSLRKYLEPQQRYVPSDVVERDADTLVCDFNLQPPPRVEGAAAACLGLIEYLHDPLAFLVALAKAYEVAVISYCTTDAPTPLEPRRAHAWVNDFDQAGLERLFNAAGWTIDRSAPVDDIQRLWRLTAAR